MKQQVNLYQPVFRRERKVFTAVTLVELAGIFILGLLAVYAYAWWQTRLLEGQSADLQQQERQDVQRLAQLEKTLPPTMPDPALVARKQQLEQTLKTKHAALDVLSRSSQSNTHGFSAALTALAREDIGGLWLDRIDINAGGTGYTLGGFTQEASLVPRYLQGLTRQPAFARTTFSALRIDRADADDRSRAVSASSPPRPHWPAGTLAFTLSTEPLTHERTTDDAAADHPSR